MTFTVRFAVAVLAAWRLAELASHEDGPGDLIARVRARVGRLMSCFQCASVWAAAPLAVWAIDAPRDWPAVWLAISGAACLIDRLAARREPVARLEIDDDPGGKEDELLRREPTTIGRARTVA